MSIITRMNNIKLTVSTDVTGITLCGIMKNIYALGMGMADGINMGENMKASLATRALKEIQLLSGDSVMTYAGVGDFMATCYSTKSRNYTYGYELANKRDVNGIM